MTEGLIRTTKPFDFVISSSYVWRTILIITKESGVISVEYTE